MVVCTSTTPEPDGAATAALSALRRDQIRLGVSADLDRALQIVLPEQDHVAELRTAPWRR